MSTLRLLAVVVDGIIVSCQVIRPREKSVGRLTSRRIDPAALVRTRLTDREPMVTGGG
jgi:hypothetical protein